MTFWVDPPALFCIGLGIGTVSALLFPGWTRLRQGAELLAVAGMYAGALGIFFNLDYFRSIWRGYGAESGTAFMINSGVFEIVPRGTTWTELGPATVLLVLVLLALYPIALHLGVELARTAVGRAKVRLGAADPSAR
jgi:hypothetical protein